MNDMIARSAIVAAVCVAATAYLADRRAIAATPISKPLAALPLAFEGWRGGVAPEPAPQVAATIGADDRVDRVYLDESGKPVGLFVAYYGTQRQRETMHSPMNCLPGAGWQPIDRQRVSLAEFLGSARMSNYANQIGSDAEVNRVLIRKGEEQQLIVYWYQSRGRTIASEYWSKFFAVLDAVRTNRTDAAIVRLNSPIAMREPAGRQAAEARLASFAATVVPRLKEHLPE